jgi:hypothetical protein
MTKFFRTVSIRFFTMAAVAAALPAYAQDIVVTEAKIDGGKLVFSPVTHEGSLTWNCKSASGTDIADKYRPTVCRG